MRQQCPQLQKFEPAFQIFGRCPLQASSLLLVWVFELTIFRKKAFLTWQPVPGPGPAMLVFGKHMELGLEHLRIVQSPHSDRDTNIATMKCEWASAVWTKAALNVL